jgi:hypothetical protein
MSVNDFAKPENVKRNFPMNEKKNSSLQWCNWVHSAYAHGISLAHLSFMTR